MKCKTIYNIQYVEIYLLNINTQTLQSVMQAVIMSPLTPTDRGGK